MYVSTCLVNTCDSLVHTTCMSVNQHCVCNIIACLSSRPLSKLDWDPLNKSRYTLISCDYDIRELQVKSNNENNPENIH